MPCERRDNGGVVDASLCTVVAVLAFPFESECALLWFVPLFVDVHREEMGVALFECAPLEVGVDEVAGEVRVEEHGRQCESGGGEHVQMLFEAVDAQCARMCRQESLQCVVVAFVMWVECDRMGPCDDRDGVRTRMSRFRVAVDMQRP